MDESISLIDQQNAVKNRSGVPIHVVAAIFLLVQPPYLEKDSTSGYSLPAEGG
jgi:hypothetical protein